MYPNWIRQLSYLYLWISLCYPDAERNPTNQSKEARLSLNTRNILKISDELTTTTTPEPTKNVVTNQSIGIHTCIRYAVLHRVKRNERNEVPRRTLARVYFTFACVGLLATKKGLSKQAHANLVRLRATRIFLFEYFLSFIRTLAPSLRQNESDNQRDLWTQLITHYIVTDVHSSFASIAAALCKD